MAVLFVVVFLINAATKNIEFDGSLIFTIRNLCALGSFIILYFTIQIYKSERRKGIIRQIGYVAVWTGLFLGAYLLTSFIPLKGFESRNFKLYPRDYITIFLSSLLSIVAAVFAVFVTLYLKDLVHYKRKKTTKRNFLFLMAFILAASCSSLSAPQGENSVLERFFTILAVLLIIANSFRLAWIAYLPRREKFYALLYSFLSFLGFLAILIILSVETGWTQKGLLYYSYPLYTFVRLISIFGAVYFGMAGISTLFHLPTAAAFDRKQTEISSLHNLGKLINQVFDLKELVDTATTLTFEDIEAASVWLEVVAVDDERNRLVSSKNISEEEIETIVSHSSSIRSVVLQSKKFLLIDSVPEDKRTTYIPKMKKVSSLIVVPLLSHEKLIGILYASKDIEYGFEQDDVEILSGFADQVSIAIENARLIKKSIEKERLQRELMLAQEMQKRLLPQNLPHFKTVEMKGVSSPALEVGGDYYDVVMLDKHRVGIAVGDVSGKGVGAAFYMAEVKGIFQSLSKIYSSPKEFLIKANEALYGSIDKRSFISLFYAVLDTVSGTLTFSRGGHCPMLFISKERQEYIKPLGLGLGLVGTEKFSSTIKEEKISMQSGDICVFYTDGVTESRSSEGEEFGYERLFDVVLNNKRKSADEIKEEIIQTVWNFTDEKGYHDDLTIFVIKWIA
ncbi:MAG: SpoIIE family protein phosphatase [Bacteroidetes bacterium]|nr:SpoIIE family protein phosphatase [Bacteroidota bacterium]